MLFHILAHRFIYCQDCNTGYTALVGISQKMSLGKYNFTFRVQKPDYLKFILITAQIYF